MWTVEVAPQIALLMIPGFKGPEGLSGGLADSRYSLAWAMRQNVQLVVEVALADDAGH